MFYVNAALQYYTKLGSGLFSWQTIFPIPFSRWVIFATHSYFSEYFNSAHIHVMRHVPLWLRMLGKNFWCPTCSWQFHLSRKPVNLSPCPLPTPHLNRGHQYAKNTIVGDSNTFRFFKYRSSLWVIQWTEIQI